MAVERDPMNRAVPMEHPSVDFDAPTTGTTGVREECSIEAIPDMGKIVEPPANEAPNWSAENPYDAPSWNYLKPA